MFACTAATIRCYWEIRTDSLCTRGSNALPRTDQRFLWCTWAAATVSWLFRADKLSILESTTRVWAQTCWGTSDSYLFCIKSKHIHHKRLCYGWSFEQSKKWTVHGSHEWNTKRRLAAPSLGYNIWMRNSPGCNRGLEADLSLHHNTFTGYQWFTQHYPPQSIRTQQTNQHTLPLLPQCTRQRRQIFVPSWYLQHTQTHFILCPPQSHTVFSFAHHMVIRG